MKKIISFLMCVLLLGARQACAQDNWLRHAVVTGLEMYFCIPDAMTVDTQEGDWLWAVSSKSLCLKIYAEDANGESLRDYAQFWEENGMSAKLNALDWIEEKHLYVCIDGDDTWCCVIFLADGCFYSFDFEILTESGIEILSRILNELQPVSDSAPAMTFTIGPAAEETFDDAASPLP